MSSSRPVALITGGTRGIGSGIAKAYAEAGYDLLLTYNTNREAAEAFVANELLCCRAVLVGGDISLPETRDAIFDCLDTEFGNQQQLLKAMVHNAGQYVGQTAQNCDGLERAEKTVQFGDGSLLDDDGKPNLDTLRYYHRMYGEAFVDLCERSVQRMKTHGQGGSLLGISSPFVDQTLYNPGPGYSLPGAGKCLMEYSMRIYAKTCAEHGITANVLVPGFTMTDALKVSMKEYSGNADNDDFDFETHLQAAVEKRAPIKKFLRPIDLGNVAVFLSSPAGQFTTGIVMPVDGGIHMVM